MYSKLNLCYSISVLKTSNLITTSKHISSIPIVFESFYTSSCPIFSSTTIQAQWQPSNWWLAGSCTSLTHHQNCAGCDYMALLSRPSTSQDGRPPRRRYGKCGSTANSAAYSWRSGSMNTGRDGQLVFTFPPAPYLYFCSYKLTPHSVCRYSRRLFRIESPFSMWQTYSISRKWSLITVPWSCLHDLHQMKPERGGRPERDRMGRRRKRQ